MIRICAAMLVALQPTQSAAMTFGTDSRINGAYLTPVEFQKYTNVGRIECPDPDNAGRFYVTAGFITGGGDTVVTVSHAFYDPPRAGRSQTIRIEPTSCSFATYNSSGYPKDRISIRYAKIRWDITALYRDRSNDFAILKLSRIPNHIVNGPALGDGHSLEGGDVALIAFHNDLSDLTVLRKTVGQLFRISGNEASLPNNVPRSNFVNMIKTNCDAGHGSSGGFYIDSKSGMAIGLHLGSFSPLKTEHGEFSKENTYNFGVLFDEILFKQVREVVKDNPFTEMRITDPL